MTGACLSRVAGDVRPVESTDLDDNGASLHGLLGLGQAFDARVHLVSGAEIEDQYTIVAECRPAVAARHRVDRRHGPVRHSVRLAFSGISTMTQAAQNEVKIT